MKVSVILRTDGAPSFLEKAIWGYATQCHRDFELLIADHSLTQETGLLIQRMRNETDLNLRLVLEEGGSIHQPVVLNKAICAASSDFSNASQAPSQSLRPQRWAPRAHHAM